MRKLIDQSGCLIQIILTFASGYLLISYTPLPTWGSVLLSIPAGVLATFAFVFTSAMIFDRLGID